MPPDPISDFALYGENPQERDERFIHVEALEERSRPSNWTIRPHRHLDLHQIFVVTSGAGDISMDAERRQLAAPLMVLAPAGVVHAFTWPAGSEGYVLTVADAYFREVTSGFPDLSRVFEHAVWLEFPDPESAKDIASDLARFMDEVVWRGPHRDAALFAHLVTTLVAVARVRYSVSAAEIGVGAASRIVSGFRELMERRFRTSSGIADYAAALGVSEKQLRQACRKVAGLSPVQQLRRRRALEAQRLLTYSSMTISEISYALGFDDPAYFSRVFSADAGQSPAAFRKARSRILTADA